MRTKVCAQTAKPAGFTRPRPSTILVSLDAAKKSDLKTNCIFYIFMTSICFRLCFSKVVFFVYDIFMIFFIFSFMFYFMFLICFVEVPFSCLPFSVCVFLAIFRQIHQSFLACGWRSVQGSWFASQIYIKYAEGLQNFMSVMWLIRASVAQDSRGPKIEKTETGANN